MAKNPPKYKWLDYNKKQEIIEILKYNERNGVTTNLTDIGRRYNVSRSTIKRISDTREDLEGIMEKHQNIPCISKRKRVPIVKNDRLDKALYEWFKQKQAADEQVTANALQKEALLMNESMKGDPKFKASDGWLFRFINRYELRACNIEGKQIISSTKGTTDEAGNFERVEVEGGTLTDDEDTANSYNVPSTSTGLGNFSLVEIKEELLMNDDNAAFGDQVVKKEKPADDEMAEEPFKFEVGNSIEDRIVCPDVAEAEKALHSFQEYREWFEKQAECGPEDLIHLKRFHERTVDVVSRIKYANKNRNIPYPDHQ